MANLTGVLTIPKLRLKCLNIPSQNSLLVLTETDLTEMKMIQKNFENDLQKYRNVKIDVPIEKSTLEELQCQFDQSQTEIISQLISEEANQIIKTFWSKGMISILDQTKRYRPR